MTMKAGIFVKSNENSIISLLNCNKIELCNSNVLFRQCYKCLSQLKGWPKSLPLVLQTDKLISRLLIFRLLSLSLYNFRVLHLEC